MSIHVLWYTSIYVPGPVSIYVHGLYASTFYGIIYPSMFYVCVGLIAQLSCCKDQQLFRSVMYDERIFKAIVAR